MENNKPAEPQTQPGPAMVQSAPPSGGGNKVALWMILGLLVLGAIGGAYWYLNKQATPATNTETPTASQEPKTESSLDQDLDAIQVEATDSGLDTVDKDIQSL